METIVIIVIVVGVFVFRKSHRRPLPKYTPKHEPLKRRSFKSTPAPFDVKTSKAHVPEEVLSGPAYVVDGDTLRIRKTQIRLFGVDAPELNHPYGKKAKWALVSLCKGQVVQARITAKDTHGRTVAKCTLSDDRDLSAEMVKLGLAIDWPKFSGGQYRALEVTDVRKKLWLADARQKGHMHVWERFEANQSAKNNTTQSASGP